MVFYRKIKFSITFECRSTDKQDDEGNDRIVVDQSEPITINVPIIKFVSRDEAYRIAGDLDTWANAFAETFADEYANARCPGPTVYASDWNGIVDSAEEWEECPDFVKAEIARLEIRKLRVREEVSKMIDVEIEAIKRVYHCE